MRHRPTLLLPLLLAACNGSPFPSSKNEANASSTSNSVSTTTTTTNIINAAAPATPPPPADANAANAALPDGNQTAAVPPAADGNTTNPNANDHVGGRELAEEASNLDFIVVNRTGHKIIGLSIKPFDDNHWSNNVLAGRDVPDKERAAATYSRDVEICRWDLKATFDNGTARVFPNFNLCDTVRVELR